MTYKEQYKEEITKIKRRIRNIEKRGYNVGLDKTFTTPEKVGKRDIEKLQRTFSLENIYAQSTHETEFGTVSGTEYRTLERKSAAQKGAKTKKQKNWEDPSIGRNAGFASYENTIRSNIQNLISYIESWTPIPDWTDATSTIKEQQKNVLLSKIHQALSDESNLANIAQAIQDNAQEIYDIAYRIMYETYKFDLVYSPKSDYYSPTEDYIRIETILTGGMLPFEEQQEQVSFEDIPF